jgi:pyruvate,water dikinase
VIHGYLYINCENVKTGIACVPPGLRLPDLQHLLPPSVRSDSISFLPAWKLAAIALRSMLLFFLEPGVNPILCLWLARRHRKKVNHQIDQLADMPTASPPETVNKIQLTLETLSRLQIYNQWPYFYATFTTWALRWLAVDHMGYSHNDFLNRISQNARNVTIEIERNFRNMAREIVRDEDLAHRFKGGTADQLAVDLPDSIRTLLDRFLSRYGCRSRHRTLLIKRWMETPEEVIGILQSLVRNQPPQAAEDSGGNFPAAVKNEGITANPVGPSAIGVHKFFPVRTAALWLLTLFNRRFLDLREDLRFALDRILYLLRQTLLVLGEQLDLGDGVFFLEEGELKALAKGNLSLVQACQKARRRRDLYRSPFDVATYYNNGRAENEFDTDGMVLHGIGTSPGRVQGHAKIVEDPVLADITGNHILIARNTDPGWTPILSIVRGMVIEEGGLLNHCSIVARELGIPSVVGVRGATRQIRDNDLLTIDGGLGVVKIER